jgi:putative SOS response-associated peptidase YedK
MCGRFVIYATTDDVEKTFNIVRFVSEFKPNYNVAPTQKIPVIVDESVQDMTWGLQLGKFNVINTRVESIEKPIYKKMEPCIIIANGFFEWKDKKPNYITLKNRKLFGLAGLYYGDKCTIITTTPNDFMKNIHTRMPVIIPKGKEKEWLKNKSLELLKPTDELMQAVNVSSQVNSPKFNSIECIKEV